ncbi:hypothetical protein ACTFIW_012094 [Dictyostelium discoideum]
MYHTIRHHKITYGICKNCFLLFEKNISANSTYQVSSIEQTVAIQFLYEDDYIWRMKKRLFKILNNKSKINITSQFYNGLNQTILTQNNVKRKVLIKETTTNHQYLLLQQQQQQQLEQHHHIHHLCPQSSSLKMSKLISNVDHYNGVLGYFNDLKEDKTLQCVN